jgi:eukaryotic-like serine/threonine-protein kinase
LGEDHPETLKAMEHFGSLLVDVGKLDEAEHILRNALERSRRVLPADSGDTLIATWLLGKCLVAQRRYGEAETLLVSVEPAFRTTFGPMDPPRFSGFLSILGRARTGLGKFVAAQTNLLEAQANISRAYGPTDHRLRPLIQALIDLYTAWNSAEPGKGYDAKAAEWKKRLDAINALHPQPASS